ncbi:MAG: putative redox-active protein (C_GCAxxG_C_C) [Smithella sp. PtaU1.Bin162]|nr:MAG: putative redox-active protein (C_GCAxxG_C_C) [Smithella sp. PtaU1.Bin162]
MSKSLEEKAYEQGFEYEKNYGGCAQCAIGALYDVFPELTNKDVFKSATGLGGGVGLSNRGNCGALTGVVMVLSNIYGRDLKDITDPEKKRFLAYKLGKKMADKFLAEYATVTCGEIQTKIMGRSFDMYKEFDAFIAAGGHSTACTSVVGKAARWAAQLILEARQKGIEEVLRI